MTMVFMQEMLCQLESQDLTWPVKFVHRQYETSSCPTHNSVLHGGIFILFDINNLNDKVMSYVEEPCCYSKIKHSPHLNFVHRSK